ncbi:hypothetical protein ACQEVX_04180 [Streptomyces syringium]|uniref:hypothetical protein n=1 Tax=Streptomyces syringium TaxID=76729 RepID=UPI003D927154
MSVMSPGNVVRFEFETAEPQATRDVSSRAVGRRFEGEGPYQSILTGGPHPADGLYDHSGREGGGRHDSEEGSR